MGMLNNIKISPLKGKTSIGYSSDFGERILNGEKNFHSGIDFPGRNGAKEIIVAVAPGKVVAMRNNIKGFSTTYSSGNYVTIDHGNGIKTVYCHMEYNTIKVKVGDYVVANQELGLKGKTGHSFGEHCHFGINVNGKYVDPKPYILGTKSIVSNNKYIGVLPTPPTRGYFMKNDRGEQVKVLQKFLNWCLGCNLAIDGIIGNLTVTQIKNFQKKYNLKIDGYFGPSCIKKMKEVSLID